MKYFKKGGKINLVDENNVFVGYDIDQDCCEYADWFIAETPQDTYQSQGDTVPDLTNFVFDQSFFFETSGGIFDGGGMAIFRLHDGGKELFLHIFNAHNGYYGHGFEFSTGDTEIQTGVL